MLAGKTLTHDQQITILKRRAVTFRVTKGSSLDAALQLQERFKSGGGAAARCSAALSVLVNGAHDSRYEVEDLHDSITSMKDIYEAMEDDKQYGTLNGDDGYRRLTAEEKADLRLR